MLIGIALLFLGVCLVNVVGLLLAKFLNNAALTGLRRALGASRRDIVRQHLAEVLLLGAAGGVLGLVLAMAGLHGIRGLYDFEADLGSWQRLTSIDFTVVLVTFGLSLLAGAAGRPLSGVAHRPHGARRLPEDAVSEATTMHIQSHPERAASQSDRRDPRRAADRARARDHRELALHHRPAHRAHRPRPGPRRGQHVHRRHSRRSARRSTARRRCARTCSCCAACQA